MQLNVGDVVEGKIAHIKEYGVFVDLPEGKSGMVHISEVARTYVNDINEHVKLGDQVKVKVMNIAEDGKISLSIRRAMESEKRPEGEFRKGQKRERTPVAPPAAPDPTYTWTPKKSESASFEEMMNRFKQSSEEKFSDLKRKNPETRRSKRGAGVR